MAVYNLEYKDGEIYVINMDFGSKDITLQRTKAGNTKTWAIRDFGTGLQRDECIVSYFQTEYDSEGDPLYNPGIGRTTIINDADYFTDMIQYTNAGGILNQAKVMIDVLLKQRLEQTRVFNIAGDFIQPIYFSLDGSANTYDPSTGLPNDDGTLIATIDVSGGYADVEIRAQLDGSTWSNWLNVTNDERTFSGLEPGLYHAEVRTTDVSLMIEPTESYTVG